MNEFLPELELIDRLCIARVKYERTGGANQKELQWYELAFYPLGKKDGISEVVKELTEIHNHIWDLEWQLKSGVEEQLSLEEIGRRAIKIRDYNNKRIALKNSVSKLLNSSVVEIKQDHLSE
jgi:hypothetical protein